MNFTASLKWTVISWGVFAALAASLVLVLGPAWLMPVRAAQSAAAVLCFVASAGLLWRTRGSRSALQRLAIVSVVASALRLALPVCLVSMLDFSGMD
jgi:hypothetical protein